MTDRHNSNRSRDMIFFIFGLVGALIAYYGLRAIVGLYNWIASTDIVGGFVAWWTNTHTLTIVPIEVVWSLIGLALVALIIWIAVYFMLYDPHMFH